MGDLRIKYLLFYLILLGFLIFVFVATKMFSLSCCCNKILYDKNTMSYFSNAYFSVVYAKVSKTLVLLKNRGRARESHQWPISFLKIKCQHPSDVKDELTFLFLKKHLHDVAFYLFFVKFYDHHAVLRGCNLWRLYHFIPYAR